MPDLTFSVAIPWLSENSAFCTASGSTLWGCDWFPAESPGIRYSRRPHDPSLARDERIQITVSSSLAHLCAALQQGAPSHA